MTNTDNSASHLVSISHDPLEEGTERRDWGTHRPMRDESMGRRMGQAWDSGRQSLERGTHMVQEAMPEHPMRPLLLAGAVGLLAAWIVSGMTADSGEHRRQRRVQRFRQRREAFRTMNRNEGSPTYASRGRRYDTPPEGKSSEHEFAMDALNP